LKRFLSNILILLGATGLVCCQKGVSPGTKDTGFDSVPTIHQLVPLVNEISGIADSKINSGYIWGQEDSGTPPQIYLIKHDGTVVKKIYLKGITNRDWEDMALFNNEIYIAETGDNSQVYPDYKFYKFAEPSAATDTVSSIETISFTYPDGSHDAEAFLIDPASKNIFIITKRDNPSKIYKLSYPYGSSNTVSYVGSLPYTGVVSAAMSADGKELVVKTYISLFYYSHAQGESLDQSLQKTYTSLKYVVEPQGEAVGFAADGSGFYTLSEKAFSSIVNLCFYKRK
jgi:hypothetical protein